MGPIRVSAAPLVSFAVPAYNHAAYIGQCLDSIADEPYPNKELWIVDDGSTDNTAAVIREWIVRRRPAFPVDFVSRPNRGVSATLNELIGKYRGQYLRPCSSDDYLVPGTLEAMIRALEANPSKQIVIGDATVIDMQGRKVSDSTIFDYHRGRKANYFSDAGLQEEIIKRWSLAGPLQMVRRGFYEAMGGYDEKLKVEDWDLMLRTVAKNQLLFVDLVVAAYRVHETNSFRLIKDRDPVGSAHEYLRILEKNHALFQGPMRRELDYRLLKQRGIVAALQRGAPAGKLQMLGIRLSSRWRSLLGPVP